MRAKILEGLCLIPVVLIGAVVLPLLIPIVAIACIGMVISASKYDL